MTVALRCVDCGRPFVAAGPVDYCPGCVDVDYAEQEASGQLAIGVTGEQRAFPGLAKPGVPAPVREEG